MSMDRRIERPKWRRPLLVGGGIAAAALLAAAYFATLPARDSVSVDSADVTIAQVRRAPFEEYLPVRATAEPEETVFIDAVEGGRVARVLVEDGDQVKAGQVLAILESPQLELTVRGQEAEITGQLSGVSAQRLANERNAIDREQALADARFALAEARRDHDRIRFLHDRGIAADAALAQAEAELAYQKERADALAAGLARDDQLSAQQRRDMDLTTNALRRNLNLVRGSLGALEIRAPIDGRLTSFEVRLGQSIESAGRVGQVDSIGRYRMVAEVDEFYLGRIEVGQTASGEVGGRGWPMSVSRVLPQVREGRFRIELEFAEDAPAGLRRGQAINVRLNFGGTADALVAPSGPWLQTTGGNWIYVVDANGRQARRKPIQVARRNPAQVAIEEGVRPGDRVIVSDYAAFEGKSVLALR
jgi:HlyD family secretion protein